MVKRSLSYPVMMNSNIKVSQQSTRPEVYKSLFEGSPDAMLLIENNLFVACNSATLNMLKLSSEEELFELHPSVLSPLKQPCGEYSKVKAEQMMAIAYDKGSHRFEWIHIDKDNKPFRVEVLLTRLNLENRNLIHVVWRDISAVYEKYRQLEISKIFYDSVADAIMITDENAIIIEVNSAFEHITGYSFKEAVGQPAGFMKSGKYNADFYRKMWDAILINGQWKGTLYDKHKSGVLYKKQLRIQSVKNSYGVVENYIAVFTDDSQQANYEKKLRQLAYYDALTNLPNRRLILKSLNQKIGLSGNSQQFSLCFIDVDNFKHINDSHGHYVGDRILKEMTTRLTPLLENEDLLGRMSGDEFIFVIHEQVEPQELAKIAQRVIAVFKEPIVVGHTKIALSISMGISSYPHHGLSLNDILISADVAMYRAKELKGSHFHIYDEELGETFRLESLMHQNIENALASQSFVPYFQPQLDLKTNQYCGSEVLARWFTDEGAEIGTHQFITYAEKSGQIKPISEMIMSKSMAIIANSDDLVNKHISLNLSGVQLSSLSLYDEIIDILTKTGLPYECLELEVTESMLIECFETASQSLVKLRKLGVKVALDDFGTGYSSLSYLKKFPIDTIKIDKCFIDDIVGGPQETNESFVIVKGIIQLAHALGLEVVAEGIEHPEQLALLRDVGCDKIQGYYYAKPMSFTDLNNQLTLQN